MVSVRFRNRNYTHCNLWWHNYHPMCTDLWGLPSGCKGDVTKDWFRSWMTRRWRFFRCHQQKSLHIVVMPGGHRTEIKHFRQVETGSQISLNWSWYLGWWYPIMLCGKPMKTAPLSSFTQLFLRNLDEAFCRISDRWQVEDMNTEAMSLIKAIQANPDPDATWPDTVMTVHDCCIMLHRCGLMAHGYRYGTWLGDALYVAWQLPCVKLCQGVAARLSALRRHGAVLLLGQAQRLSRDTSARRPRAAQSCQVGCQVGWQLPFFIVLSLRLHMYGMVLLQYVPLSWRSKMLQDRSASGQCQPVLSTSVSARTSGRVGKSRAFMSQQVSRSRRLAFYVSWSSWMIFEVWGCLRILHWKTDENWWKLFTVSSDRRSWAFNFSGRASAAVPWISPFNMVI